MKTFYCDCKLHSINVDKRPLKLTKNLSLDFLGLTIYEYRSPVTGKIFKKPKELGTVVLINKEAKKFKEYIINETTK